MSDRWFSAPQRVLEPGVNLFSDDEAIVWVRLIRDCDSYDLVVEECGDSLEGMSKTFSWLWDVQGLDEWLKIDSWKKEFKLGGYSWDFHGAAFGLESGIAPGQMFAVSLGVPVTTTSYYGDCDVETDFEIVSVERWPKSRVARAWDSYLAYFRKKIDKEILLADSLKTNKLPRDCFSLYWNSNNKSLSLCYEHMCPLLDHTYAKASGDTLELAKERLVKELVAMGRATMLSIEDLDDMKIKYAEVWQCI